MADINITFTIPDAYVDRLSNVIDVMWPGRELQEPIPTKIQWFRFHIISNVKQQVLVAEKNNANIQEIEIT